MSINYKYFPEQKLIYEVVDGTVSVDQLSAFFMKIQLDKHINQADYFLIDHRNMILKLNENELKRAGEVFSSFGIILKKWAIIYKDLKNKEKLETALAFYKQKHQTEIEFFHESCEKEVCQFLGIKEFPKL